MDTGNLRAIVIFILLAVVVVGLHQVPGLDASRVDNGIRNAIHVIGFAGVAAVMYETLPFGRLLKALISLGTATAIGIAAETAQKALGSNFDLFDLYRDIAGAGLYVLSRLVWSISSESNTQAGLRLLLRFASASIGLAVFIPLMYWSSILIGARLKSPVILDFDGTKSELFYKEINAEISLKEGSLAGGGLRMADIRLSGWGRSGIVVQTAVRDWSTYSSLVFDAMVHSGPPTTLTVHINDHSNIGRFADVDAGIVTIMNPVGEYRVSISDVIEETNRQDDISNIRQLVLLARDRRKGTRIFIDNIRLE